MKLEEIPAKSLVTRTLSAGWFGAEYNMNIYRGCSHGCIYCDSRSDCYQNRDFGIVKAKANALGIIEGELNKKIRRGVIATGAMSDPYNPHEAEHRLTRGALALIHRYGFGVAIDTKSGLVARDLDLLREIRGHSPVIVKLTITTLDEALCRRVEPDAPPVADRLAALRTLAEGGIFCGVLLMPILPFVNDTEENVLGILRAAAENGARFVHPAFGVTMRSGQREYFLGELEKIRPGMAARYRSAFGGDYHCPSPEEKALRKAFHAECAKLGMLSGMGEITTGYKADYESTQLSLF